MFSVSLFMFGRMWLPNRRNEFELERNSNWNFKISKKN